MQNTKDTNVLLITIDSLRKDYLGCYNSKIKNENLTPNIDSFATNCFVFTKSFSQGNRTSVTFPALFSGQYPFHFGYEIALHRKRKTIAEILHENNYSTAGFHSNPYISREFHYERGFDCYEDNLYNFENLKNRKLKSILRKLSIFFNTPYKNALDINKQVLSHVKKIREPYFLWIHYMDTHGPYLKKSGLKFINTIISARLWQKCLRSPDKIDNKEHKVLVDSYKEEVKYVDHCIGTLIKEIDDKNTIIILTSDHGELLGEHGIYGHDHNHYDPLFNVPLLIKLPSNINLKPKKVKEMSQSIDICPTICDLLSIKPKIQFDGISLLPYMKEETKEKRKYIIHEIQKNYFCIRNERYKHILNKRKNKKEILFDLLNDPGEKENCLEKNKNNNEVSFLIEELEKHISLKRINDQKEIDGFDNMSEEVKNRLKALGYL